MLAQLAVEAVAAASYRCVFMHGAGWPNSSAPTATDTDSYWGGDANINKLTPYCSSRTFIHQETLTRAWDDAELQRAVCEAAVGDGNTDSLIRNTMVFAHSMGNLVVAGALRQQVCSLDSSSRFVAISALWRGSKGCAAVEQACSNTSAGEAFHWMAEKSQHCDGSRPGKAPRGYESMDPGYPALAGLAEFAAERVDFALCGRSPFGLTSTYSIAMEALAHMVGYGEENDGMVPLSSCLLPGKTYNTHWRSAFYDAEVNHVDGTFRNGDGSFSLSARQPSSWVSSLFGEERAETVLV
jgi:hypothetical protein